MRNEKRKQTQQPRKQSKPRPPKRYNKVGIQIQTDRPARPKQYLVEEE